MVVTFSEIPANLRVPGFYVELGASGGNVVGTGQPYKLAMIGQKLSGGTAPANVPVQVTRAEDAAILFGSGSMLHAMVREALANSAFVAPTVIPMDDPAGTVGTQTITVTAAANGAGVIPLYIAGQRVPVPTTAAQSQNDIATAIVTAVNGRTDLPVTAAAATNVVTLTAKHDGLIGGEIDVRVGFFEDEAGPTGVSYVIAVGATAAGSPDLASALAALGDEHYNIIAVPYTETALLTTLTTELISRGSATRQIGALAFTASTANLATLQTLGAGQNSEHLSIIGASASPSPPWSWAAAVAALVTQDAQNDPARPFSTVQIHGVLMPRAAARLDDLERNTLLYTGIATVRANGAGAAAIERLISTYQTNDLGAADPSFLDITSLLTVERLRYEMRQLGGKFARFKIADDGTNAAPGSEVITPNGMKGEIVALYSSWEDSGWVENIDAFSASLLVERNGTDPTRLDIRMNPDIVNALRIVGALVSFTL